jgi:hypothetical protein
MSLILILTLLNFLVRLDIPRWLFKVDDEYLGRGHAWIEVKHTFYREHILLDDEYILYCTTTL